MILQSFVFYQVMNFVYRINAFWACKKSFRPMWARSFFLFLSLFFLSSVQIQSKCTPLKLKHNLCFVFIFGPFVFYLMLYVSVLIPNLALQRGSPVSRESLGFFTIIILSFWTDMSRQTVQTQIKQLCHSFSNFSTHYSIVKPYC